MKNRIILSLLSALVVVSSPGCSDFLDINKDPRYPAEASSKMLFASGVTWSAARLGRDGQLVGELWSQHYAQGNTTSQYRATDNYNMANSAGEPTAIWSSIYTGALPDFKITIAQAEANEEWNYWLAAKVMTAFDFNLLVSFWEKVPFTNALAGTASLEPAYDESKAIDAGIIALLEEAIAKKAEAKALVSMGTNDFVLGGNIDNWVKFAKTLKLKVLMRDFAANQAAIQTLVTEGDLLTTADARLSGFTDATNYSNPLYEADRRALNTKVNLRASATLVAYLRANNDPRIANFFGTVTDNLDGTKAPANTYRGLDQGSSGYENKYSGVNFPLTASSEVLLAATDPVYFLSASDAYFLIAEAYARLGDAAQAKTNYDAGVEAAFARWNHKAAAATFTGAGGAYEFDATNLESQLKSILTQKWVSTTRCNSWDTFFDINRTGIPAVGTVTVNLTDDPATQNPSYVLGTLAPPLASTLPKGDFPRRFLFTKSSSDYNSNTPDVDEYPLVQKMWWHK